MKDALNVKVGERVRIIRTMLDISAEEMAEGLELSTGHFQKLERGEHAFNLLCMQLLHERYGIDLNYLIVGRRREEDLAKEILMGTPEELFYFLHQLLAACERIYREGR